MSRIRKLTARHMSYSQATSVHVTTLFHIDMTRIVEIRERVKAAFEREHGTKLTFMPFIFRALATALRAHPKFNAAIDGETIVYKKDVNLGMAVALDWGLIVPVIHDADQASLAGLARKANDLAERARAKKLKPDEIQRGTFTVTNPGVFGSLFGTPIINQPQVAILCIGAIEKRPVVVTDAAGRDAIAIRNMAYFALTYDHRLIDGADAELFMRDVKATLESESWSELPEPDRAPRAPTEGEAPSRRSWLRARRGRRYRGRAAHPSDRIPRPRSLRGRRGAAVEAARRAARRDRRRAPAAARAPQRLHARPQRGPGRRGRRLADGSIAAASRSTSPIAAGRRPTTARASWWATPSSISSPIGATCAATSATSRKC